MSQTRKRGFQGAVMRILGTREHLVTVTGAEFLAPGYKRVHFISMTLFNAISFGPRSFLRFWVPDPKNPQHEYQRAYTVLHPNPSKKTFSVDFFLHEPAGPGSTWAQNAEPGMTLSVMTISSKSFNVPDELPRGYLIAGDPSSLPAINSMLEVIPATVLIDIYLEQHNNTDKLIPITAHDNMTIHWVPRISSISLAKAIQSGDWTGWHAHFMCEAGTLKVLRERTKKELKFPRSNIFSQSYWINGKIINVYRKLTKEEKQALYEMAHDPKDNLLK